ncbi:MAG TPA: CHAP domain-containing protein [Syntrophomonadaceae bacterium]|nr:CHAP domain-containing protein [Syntrophomonadaceae bacterium]
MTTANQIITEARKWIGVKQGTAKHKNLVDAYNSISPKPRGYTLKMTDDWCDAFVTVVFDKAGASNLIGREVGVQRHIDIFKSKGIWIEDGKIKPKVGDIITYNWDDGTQPNTGWADHIGIVEKVGTKYITVIEGNISYRVDKRRIEIGHGNIRGYARPKYKSASTPKLSITEMAKKVKAGEYGVQPERQKLIEKEGYNYEEVQAEVNKISADKKTPKHTAESIANDIWKNPNHAWGTGATREHKITEAGVSYEAVRSLINKLAGISGGGVKKSGRWQFSTNVNIRSKPSINSEKVGLYKVGQTVDISNTIQKGGYLWGEYKAYSGNVRYVALGIIGGIQYGKWI